MVRWRDRKIVVNYLQSREVHGRQLKQKIVKRKKKGERTHTTKKEEKEKRAQEKQTL